MTENDAPDTVTEDAPATEETVSEGTANDDATPAGEDAPPWGDDFDPARDMETIALSTRHVTGLSRRLGGSGAAGRAGPAEGTRCVGRNKDRPRTGISLDRSWQMLPSGSSTRAWGA